MKNDTTFQIELDSLQELMSKKDFEEAEKLASRMLTQYNKFDYDLLLKRARIKQCLMKYEEALLDATLAHNILPQRMEAYNVLSDFLVALNDHKTALQILHILVHTNEQKIDLQKKLGIEDVATFDSSLKEKYKILMQSLETKEPESSIKSNKNHQKILKQIRQARNQTYFALQAKDQSDDIETIIKTHLYQERNSHMKNLQRALAKESCMKPKLFVEKSKEFRKRYEVVMAQDMVYLSDEMEQMEEFENLGPSQDKKITKQQTRFINEKILGFQRDYAVPDMEEDEKADEEQEG